MFNLGGKPIGGPHPCFIVAEAGLAHGGKPENAYKLIDMAVDGGADAVKFQIYRTKELISKERSPEWFERYQSKELPYDEFRKLKEYAERKKIFWFATPHTESAIDYLRSIHVDCYKVGSGEHEIKAIEKVIDTGRPVIISTGLRSHSEVLDLIDRYGGEGVAFLHCTTIYPAPDATLNLGFIRTMRTRAALFGSVVGYSDHTEGTYACELAVALGAKIIEKHICLPDSKGQDVAVSLKGNELETFVRKIRRIEKMVGDGFRHYTDREKESEAWALKSKEDGRRPI